jgi:hypothetical protein
MKKPFVKLASKLLTLAVLVGCLSVVAPSRTVKASWIGCWTDWSGCMGNCGDPTASGFDGCWDQCDQNLFICESNIPEEDQGFKIER